MSGFVYAISDGTGRVKIGWSSHPIRRLNKISSDCSSPVVLLGLIEATRRQEQEVHQVLAPWRANREWFFLTGPVAQFVGMLPRPQPKSVRTDFDTSHPIAAWRQRTGTPLADLAALLGVNRISLWRWEHCERMPKLRQLSKIEAVTGVTASDLVAAMTAAMDTEAA